MKNQIELSNEKFQEIYVNIEFCKSVKNAHWQADKNGVRLYKITCTYPTVYIVKDEQIKEAQKEFNRLQKEYASNMQKNVLYLIGMGMTFEKNELSDVENFRVRGYFQNSKSDLHFVEFSGNNREEKFYCDHSLYFPDGNIEEEKHHNFGGLEKNQFSKYTKENILKIVNKTFNCNFVSIEIDQYSLMEYYHISVSE